MGRGRLRGSGSRSRPPLLRGAPGVTIRSQRSLVGAIVRVETDAGPRRACEVHAGIGYWSLDGQAGRSTL
ncbi:MAG: hypothetical protein AB7R55_10795 [Gemmatimonadales bacterium]